ncbi:uncharacterized protein HMPREF1541_05240 [Cyphellophora europaea CBS 101466]|uniref:RRM domain-containing protein n=1 Tax=Cyphellophora europaea (strain CBS 101466) TaxID=1220924 RepID=W2RXC6_CYPE1|nr:uncharacterized protein HMPREF1541_05240 [Cyphellophora europaea CBS 101466]ETN40960.1 hypothetical protein HMPREF1541_05240 [Cyphellophora europaea CBS 101466]
MPQHTIVFTGPADLRGLAGQNLEGCHLHFNGPFRFSDLADLDLKDAILIINPQGSGQGFAPGYLMQLNEQPTATDVDGGNLVIQISKNNSKRKRSGSDDGLPDPARFRRATSRASASLTSQVDITEDRLRHDDLEDSEMETSPPAKRNATQKIDEIHPARARMISDMAKYTQANMTDMPFNRLDQSVTSTDWQTSVPLEVQYGSTTSITEPRGASEPGVPGGHIDGMAGLKRAAIPATRSTSLQEGDLTQTEGTHAADVSLRVEHSSTPSDGTESSYPGYRCLWIEEVVAAATEQDIRALFPEYSVDRVVMLNNEALGGSTGFVMVTMASVEDARSACLALANAKLHGRNLFIEQIPHSPIASDRIAL